MIKVVWATNEVRFVRVDTELYFNDHFFPVHKSNQNVSCFCGKFVLDLHDPQLLRVIVVNPFNLVVQGDNLCLLWRALTSEQISNPKTDGLWNIFLILLFYFSHTGEPMCCWKKSMDQGIEIIDHIILFIVKHDATQKPNFSFVFWQVTEFFLKPFLAK